MTEAERIKDIITKLSNIPRWESHAGYEGSVVHDFDEGGGWIKSADIDELIKDLQEEIENL